MRILTKINRGAILFTFVLIAVITYLIVAESFRTAEKPVIKDLCTRYIAVETTYRMLPEKYRVPVPKIPKDEKEAYIAQMKTDIAAFYPSGELGSKYIFDTLTQGIENQASGKNVVLELKKSVDKFTDIIIDGDTATVNISVNTTYNGPDSMNPSGLSRTSVETTSDTVILQKIGGVWKVVYSNLAMPMSAAYPAAAPYKY